MREDILAGLKNALERGSTLQQAIQTLINSGYDSNEVNLAAQSLTSSATSMLNQKKEIPSRESQSIQKNPPLLPDSNQLQIQKIQNQQKPLSQPIKSNSLPTQINSIQSPKKTSHKTLIILLSVILLLLIGGLIYFIFFGDNLINSLLSK